ncbi:hypothetical protein GCM10028804_62230 [Larkinella terrae]
MQEIQKNASYFIDRMIYGYKVIGRALKRGVKRIKSALKMNVIRYMKIKSELKRIIWPDTDPGKV